MFLDLVVAASTSLVTQGSRRLAEDAPPLSAFVWWLIPLFGFLGAIGYVVWISKFQSKYQNETSRSVDRFHKFQQSLDKEGSAPRGVRIINDLERDQRRGHERDHRI